MRIAVDMDEVLYSWERTARYLLRNEYQPADDELQAWIDYRYRLIQEPFKQWEIGQEIGKRAYDWLFNEGIHLGLFRHGHVITGAMRGVRRLKAQGHDLVIVTHRVEGGVQDTLAWLDFHFGKESPYPWNGVEILADGRPKTTVPWDLIIDDSPKNVQDAYDNGRRALQFAAAWNGWNGYAWEDIDERMLDAH